MGEFEDSDSSFLALDTEYFVEISVSANNRGGEVHKFAFSCNKTNKITTKKI
jgi:hypothetical protein